MTNTTTQVLLQSIVSVADAAVFAARSGAATGIYGGLTGGLQTPAEATRRAIDGDIDLLLEAVRRLRRARNFLSPFHRLPDEILALLFDHVVGAADSSEPWYRRLVVLSAVSTSWRRTALGFPALWCRAPSNIPLPLIDLFMERSALLPLDLEYDTNGAASDSQHLAAFSRHSYRWRSVHIKNVEVQNLEAATRDPAPSLKALHLQSSAAGSDRGKSLAAIFAGHSPMLRTLILDGVYIPLACSVYRDLTVLIISNIHFRQREAIHKFLEMLSITSPGLEELGLHFLMFSVGPSSLDPRISLLNLRALAISEYGPTWWYPHILSHISTPPSLRLKIHSHVFKKRGLDTVIPDMAPSPGYFGQIRRLRLVADAKVSESILRVVGFDCTDKLVLVLVLKGCDQLEKVLTCLNEKYHMPLLQVLELDHFPDHSRIVSLLRAFLERYSVLTHIGFGNCSRSYIKLLAASGSEQYLCPQLKELLVSSCPATACDLLDVVKPRTALGDGGVATATMQTLYIAPPLVATETKLRLEGLLKVVYHSPCL
ncbi:hypothetical protein BOTBODRAFT_218141 [Botryobasidium botryosum FD-172 SS1]|uniref:F-box domain-containing protein n=1 Tax=Botryobasidium botryosum (strain FD-172 SS1) TaxID=930990 RepID=A0A067MQA6_BOTB1|nr:hypothetical protein BOTBODRAFT_218141 [Botryobasidium botryosum FD-172 SS1]